MLTDTKRLRCVMLVATKVLLVLLKMAYLTRTGIVMVNLLW